MWKHQLNSELITKCYIKKICFAQRLLEEPISNLIDENVNFLGVIVFGSDQEVAELMKAVKRLNATGHFSWIGSDGWSARALVSEGKNFLSVCLFVCLSVCLFVSSSHM